MTDKKWSVPETEVVQRVHERLEAGGNDVLATVVDVEGNAYRRPGAKMLLDESGEGVGSITAGCLEDELLRTAESVREHGRPELVTYDLMEDDEDDVWGLGVGCNGVIDVLLDPLNETYRPAVEAFAAGRDVAILTVLDEDGAFEHGDRAYYHPDTGALTLPDGTVAEGWPAALIDPAAELASRGRADVVEVPTDGNGSGTVTVFIDGLAAPPELVVFGTGHDVGPVTELAALNDFRVTVVGFRGAVDLEERFPAVDRTVTTSPGTLEADLDVDDRTHAIVMTHNFVDDRLTVEALLDSPAPYVGLMGPTERFDRMAEEFEAEGRTLTDAELDRLYTPIGLDLGGGSPYQIAHSIVGEALAVYNDRQPRHLRERSGHIHDRIDVGADDEADSGDVVTPE